MYMHLWLRSRSGAHKLRGERERKKKIISARFDKIQILSDIIGRMKGDFRFPNLITSFSKENSSNEMYILVNKFISVLTKADQQIADARIFIKNKCELILAVWFSHVISWTNLSIRQYRVRRKWGKKLKCPVYYLLSANQRMSHSPQKLWVWV